MDFPLFRRDNMKIPALGQLTKNEKYYFFESKALPIPAFEGALCSFEIDYADEPDPFDPTEFITAIEIFLHSDFSILEEIEDDLYRYYNDVISRLDEGEFKSIAKKDIWKNVDFNNRSIQVSRRFYGDKQVYLSVSCGCTWEREHGLNLVFRKGEKVSKLGPFDGHLSNADAYANPELEGIIYKGF